MPVRELAEPGDDRLPGPSHALPSARLNSRVYIAMAVAALLVAGGAVAGVELSGPSYPHAWCGPVISELHSRGGTEGQQIGALSRIRRQDHAPIGGLVGDMTTFAADDQTAQTANNYDALGNLGTAEGDLAGIRLDLEAVNKECGLPTSTWKHETV